jgi:hypothetical protein
VSKTGLSSWGGEQTNKSVVAYCASKAAVISMTKSDATDVRTTPRLRHVLTRNSTRKITSESIAFVLVSSSMCFV